MHYLCIVENLRFSGCALCMHCATFWWKFQKNILTFRVAADGFERQRSHFFLFFAPSQALWPGTQHFSDLLISCIIIFLSFDAFIDRFRSTFWSCFMWMIDRPVAVDEDFGNMIYLPYTGHYAKMHIQTAIFIIIGTLSFFCRFFSACLTAPPPPAPPPSPICECWFPGRGSVGPFSILRWCVDDVMPAWWLFGRLPWDSIGPHIAKCSNDFCNSLWQCNPLHSIRSRRTWPLPAQWRLKLFPTELKRCHKS